MANQNTLGNFALLDRSNPKTLDNIQGQSITDLDKFLSTSKYLQSTSDIVALMALEHQVDTINYIITRTTSIRPS